MTTAKEYLERGSTQFKKNDLAGAAEFFTRAIASTESDNSPEGKLDLVQAYHMRASIHTLRNEWKRAIEDFTRVLELKEFAQAYVYRGLAYEEMDSLDYALNDLNKGIALDPSNAEAFNIRCIVRRKKGDLDGAIEDGSAAIKLDPRSEGAYTNRGVAHKIKGELDDAMADFTSAIALAPSLAVPYAERAAVTGMMVDQLLKAGKQNESRFLEYLRQWEQDLQRAMHFQRAADPAAGLPRLPETERQMEMRLIAVQELISRFKPKGGCAAVLCIAILFCGLVYFLLHRLV